MYRISYPAPGSPELARQVKDLIQEAGLPSGEDAARGFDHGTFSLLKPIYPQADVPVVQLSLKQDFNPLEHIKVGQALAPLREAGVLVLGSGFSYHNMARFGPTAEQPSAEFDRWLRQALAAKPEERLGLLSQWHLAPAARLAHPREDHLLPLMVVAGAAGNDPVTMAFGDHLFGAATSSFRFSSDQRPTGFDRLGIM
jgi:aromatic ring-opening dioxygenase catalytic subunit (LigB family)